MSSCDQNAEFLISLIEEKPALYNPAVKDYSNRAVTDRLWEEIANEIKQPVADIRRKWKILRNTYARHIRQLKIQKATFGSTAITKTKTWYLAENMAFLNDFMQQHRSIIGFSEATESQGNSADIGEDARGFETVPETLEEDERAAIDFYEREKFSNAPCKKRRIPSSIELADQSIIEVPSRVATSQDDADELFFRSLLPDVKLLSNKRRRLFKHFVISKLHDMIEEETEPRIE